MANRGLKTGIEERIKNIALVKARETLGMSRIEAAGKIGISLGSLHNYENMISYPSSETQEKICSFYRKNGQPLYEKNAFPEYLSVIAVRHIGRGISIPSELTVPLGSVKESYQINNERIDSEIIINELLKNITGRYKDILVKRFGLNGEGPKTLEEVAKEHNITRERVRQIEGYAIKTLRKKAMGYKEKDII